MNQTKIKTLLDSYLTCKRFLHSQEYAKEYFDPDGTQELVKKEEYEARMRAVESLIQYFEPSDEYTLLHLHYIKGVPIEKCAESMGMSSRTAFRMLKKVIESICNLVNKKGATDERAD